MNFNVPILKCGIKRVVLTQQDNRQGAKNAKRGMEKAVLATLATWRFNPFEK